MFSALKKIFGIPAVVTAASQSQPSSQSKTDASANFLPQSQVPENGIEGVAVDGSTWQEWRTDRNTGEQWYRRTSVDSVDARPSEIQAIYNPIQEQIEEPFDELDEQDRLSREMFARHRERARQREEENPFGLREEYEPDDDMAYDPDEPDEAYDE